jgi:alpha 1,2-mannosyltransferase
MKTVICYLSKSDEKTVNDLQKSLNLLYKNYKYIYDSDVVIFIEDDFCKTKELEISKKYSNLKFNRIVLSHSIDLIDDISTINFEDKIYDFKFGYRHMCQFFFTEIFRYISDYDWFMRLDSDSFIESEINYNLFEYLHNNNKVYGYIAEIPEWEPVVKDIDIFFLKYIKENNIKTQFTHKFFDAEKYNLRQIYNNFEIINLKYYLNNKLINEISTTINQNGNIYKKRWGDAPLRSIILSITTPIELLYKFKDIDYHHDWYKREKDNEMCFYSGYQLDLFNKWKNEGWLG